METANEIFKYLPLQYKEPSDTVYFDFLKNSVIQNFEAENYHFALVALHMIYMGIVYQYIYGFYKSHPKRFSYTLIGFYKKLDIKKITDLTWHSFARENESTIFEFYRAIGVPVDKIGNLKTPVKDRNDLVHTNGVQIFDKMTFLKQVEKYLQNLEIIHSYAKDEYLKLYKKFYTSIKIKFIDVSEAFTYLEQDFIREYNVNLIILQNLQKIRKKDYPKKINLLFNALKTI